MYDSSCTQTFVQLVIFPFKHCESEQSLQDGRQRWPTVVLLLLLLQIPFVINPSCVLPLLPLRFYFVFEYNYELKRKTKYQSFSLHSYEQVNMNTSAVTTLYLPAEFAWAPMGRKQQEKYKYIDASWPSTRYSSMPYYPSSLPSIDQPYTSSPPSQPMPCLHDSYLFRLLPTMLPPPQFQKNAPNYSAAPV